MAYRQMAGICRRAGLRQNPDFSGFVSRKIWICGGLPMVISRKPSVSRTYRWLSPGNHRFPRLTDGYLRETIGFPDLSMVISGKPSVSRTYRWLSPGNHRFPGLIDGYLRETIGFPDLSMVISGKPSVSRTYGWLSPGNHRFPGLIDGYL